MNKLFNFLFDQNNTPFRCDNHRNRNGKNPAFLNDERGGLTFSAGIVIIGMAVLIGMVGNIGHEVVQKQRLQIAADTAAYSSAVWTARGMNTICTINHLMGELNAFVVILEAMGGPEAGKGGIPRNKCPKIEDELDKWIEKKEPQATSSQYLEEVDKFLLPAATELLVYKQGEVRKCGAAILDAEITLKTKYLKCLVYKTAARTCEDVGDILVKTGYLSGLGKILILVGTVIHATVDTQILFIMSEARLLKTMADVLETIAPVKGTLRQSLVSLSGYADRVAGVKVQSLLKSPIEKTIQRIKDFYKLEQLDCTMQSRTIVLPVTPDKISSKGPAEQPLSYPKWKPEEEKNLFEDIADWIQKINDIYKKIIDTINSFTLGIGSWLSSALAEISDSFGMGDTEIGTVLSAAQRIEEGLNLLDELEHGKLKYPHEGVDDHPSKKKLEKFDVKDEQKSQLVRATYPYVDSIRAGITKWAVRSHGILNVKLLNLSNFSIYFTNWCYRYTLNESYAVRSGRFGTAHTLVLQDATRDKGNEPWIKNASLAESYFTIIVRAESPSRKPTFAPSIFHRSRSKGDVVYAQAMFYAANDQEPSTTGSVKQANAGWDTLQWEQPVNAPEWWNTLPTKKSEEHQFHKFLQGIELLDSTKMKINWQAKLVPLSNSMINKIEKDNRWIVKQNNLLTH
jgi:hypothetical protein